MQGQDRRVRRTRQQLAKALIALTLEKGYDLVTIRDIAERADIGYATFFRHYHAKDELLSDVLELVFAELIALLGSPPEASEPEITGNILFQYVHEHVEVVRVLLDSHTLRQKLLELAIQSTMREKPEQAESLVPLEVAAQHIVTSSIALIEWWLKRGMAYSPERMGLIYAELIAHPTSLLVAPSQERFSFQEPLL